jgi:hypothetical protein
MLHNASTSFSWDNVPNFCVWEIRILREEISSQFNQFMTNFMHMQFCIVN